MVVRLFEDADIERIHYMVGELSDAFWERLAQPGVSPFEELANRQYLGHNLQSDRETAVWSELTAPSNISALRKYIQFWRNQPYAVSDFAAKFHEHVLQDAEQRHSEA